MTLAVHKWQCYELAVFALRRRLPPPVGGYASANKPEEVRCRCVVVGAHLVTIAMCYVSPEGVVLGADSTASAPVADGTGSIGYHYLNYNQKLFELSDKKETGTIGVITWGLGGLTGRSHRTLLAQLVDGFTAAPPQSVQDLTQRFATHFWAAYSTDPLIMVCRALNAKAPFDPNANPLNPLARTAHEEKSLGRLKDVLVVGFCIAGYLPPDRTPRAYCIGCGPLDQAAPALTPIPMGSYGFFGAENPIKRLINGSDDNLKKAILASGKWNGTEQELDMVLGQQLLGHPILPIRDAIDFVHTCIRSTVKALKFSNFFQVCGGPIELAVITTDRKFRWVRHKEWDSAISEGEA